jgi:hypothetical protein
MQSICRSDTSLAFAVAAKRPKTHPQDQPSALGPDPAFSCSAYSVLLRCRNYRRAGSVALHRTSDDDLLGRALPVIPKREGQLARTEKSSFFGKGGFTPRVLVLFVSGRRSISRPALGLRNNKINILSVS